MVWAGDGWQWMTSTDDAFDRLRALVPAEFSMGEPGVDDKA